MTQRWFYKQAGAQFGPFDGDALRQLATAGVISDETHVCQDGQESWVPLKNILATLKGAKDDRAGSPTDLLDNLAGKISSASGLEKLEGFSASQLFSEVFRRHTPEQIEEHFAAGTRTTTPALSDVSAAWPTPWAFFRLLAASIVAAMGFYWAITRFQNQFLIPGWIFVGCFAIPFATLIFFLETNVLRNISVYRVMSLTFLGGLLSLVFSLFLFEFTKLSNWLGPIAAGPIEETGKLLAVVFFTRRWQQFHWILNGLLFGAAVGTGFSAFESAGYVFASFRASNELQPENVMTLRAFLSPFTHTIWTAATAAALWRVKGNRPFEWGMLGDMRFLRILMIMIALHCLWNSPQRIPFIGETLGYFASRLLLGLVGWIVVLLLIQSGLREIRAAQSSAQTGPPAGPV